jgi:hypothetical protein
MEGTELAKVNPYEVIAKKLDSNVIAVIGSDNILGFEKAFKVALATKELSDALTHDYMKPIMHLQGNKLGFKTDKDKEGGYTEAIVKNCLIEAVLCGVQPTGNQFNIIASNMYITKEGFGYLLSKIKGLKYDIIPMLPKIIPDAKKATIVMKIEWSIGDGPKNEKEIEFPIKVNSFMGDDAVIGKATRKARAWLFNSISDTEIADGDVQDIPHTIVVDEKDAADKKANEFKEKLEKKKATTDKPAE